MAAPPREAFRFMRVTVRSTRAQQDAVENQQAFDDYVRTTAGSGDSAAQIANAKKLLDEGTISQEEFDRLKAKALG